MTQTTASIPTQRLARLGGLCYLVIILCGVAGEGAIRGPLLADDPGQTVANLLAAETWFRLSILGDAIMVLADVALGVLLFFLLKPGGEILSMLAMAFRLVQAAVLGANLTHLHQAITLAHNTALDPTTRNRQVTDALAAHAAGYDIGLLFFAVNCLLIGALILRSGLLPRIIAIGIALSGSVYLTGSILRLAAPQHSAAFAPAYAIPLLAELAMCLWLLIKAVPPHPKT